MRLVKRQKEQPPTWSSRSLADCSTLGSKPSTSTCSQVRHHSQCRCVSWAKILYIHLRGSSDNGSGRAAELVT